MLIVLDTETTNLTAPEAAPIEQQPYIVEFAAIKLDFKSLKEIDRMQYLCKPPIFIPQSSIDITGITNEMVRGMSPFVANIPRMVDFFLGTRYIAAHNLNFDINVLRYELGRFNRVTSFPWPPNHICTVERTMHIKGHRLKLADLHEMLVGKEHKEAHRAMPDVEALVSIIRALRKRGDL